MHTETLIFLVLAVFFLSLGTALCTGRGNGLIVGYKHLFKGYDACSGKERSEFDRRIRRFAGTLFLLIGSGWLTAAIGSLIASSVLCTAGLCLAIAGALLALIRPSAGGAARRK